MTVSERPANHQMSKHHFEPMTIPHPEQVLELYGAGRYRSESFFSRIFCSSNSNLNRPEEGFFIVCIVIFFNSVVVSGPFIPLEFLGEFIQRQNWMLTSASIP
jgi:hypothetical protein